VRLELILQEADIGQKRMALIYIFVYLQVLDLLTTLVGFRLGASEASPFIRVMMHFGPAVGVVLSKLFALGLAGACVYLKKDHIIKWITYWYGGLVVWNLMVMLGAPWTH
jgi:Domain of unknown function (DUF5658)